MYRTRLLFALIYGCLIILLASACTNTPTIAPTTVPELAQATAQAIIQGETPNKEEVQTIELDNCGGKADLARTEERTQSIDVTISSEIAAEMGASAAVLTAEVQAAVGVAITPGSERSTYIELVAPPDTRMLFELVWVGNEQIGIVQNIRNSDVPVAFRSFLPTDVRLRGQYDMGCSSSSPPQTVFDPTPVAPSSPNDDNPASTELGRCEWLVANFPQSREGIASQFGLPIERIRMIYEGCGQTANGFVITEGTSILMEVPAGGCIDAPQDASFSDVTVPDGFGGLRAYSGTVRAIAMTYRPWC